MNKGNGLATKLISVVASVVLVVGLIPLPAYAEGDAPGDSKPDPTEITVTVPDDPDPADITATASFTEIYVVDINGYTLTFSAEPGDSVENVKAKIQDETGLSPERQVLFFCGKAMRDGHTLAEYNVQEDNRTLVLYVREQSYTVALDPGDGSGEPIVLDSADQPDFPDMGDAGNCQFAYVFDDAGCVGFRMDDDYCPDSFTAPDGCVFDGWEGYSENYYVFPSEGSTEVAFTAKWKSAGDSKPGTDEITVTVPDDPDPTDITVTVPDEPDVTDITVTIPDDGTYFVALTPVPSEGGTVTGEGTYSDGDTVHISASANNGYQFDHWARVGFYTLNYHSLKFEIHEDRYYEAVFVKDAENQEPTTGYTVTYKVSGGTWADGTTADKTETVVVHGASPASIPTGMIAFSGYTGGAWDCDPSIVRINADATFTYTFTVDPENNTVTVPDEVDADDITVSTGFTEIYVVDINGYTLTFSAEPGDSVESVKAKIQDKTGLSSKRQALFFCGEEMKDGHTLADYNLTEDNRTLILHETGFEKIYVVDTNGYTLTFSAEPEDSVESVKAKIQDKTGLSSKRQALFFCGKAMRDGHTLADYNLTEDNRTLILRERESNYTVTLAPGDGSGESIVLNSADQSDFPDMGDAGNCQFAYVFDDSGCVGFLLDGDYCPDSFAAPDGCVFDGWEGYSGNYYVFPTEGSTEVTFTAKWKSADDSSSSGYGLINDIPASDGGYIWMGSTGDPIRWHVIGANSSNYLLISAEVLGDTMDWNSALDYCGTLFTSRFTDVERAAVPTTIKSEPTDYQYMSYFGYYFGPSTVNGNMFLLSAEEAETYFSKNAARQPGWWWLRSLDSSYTYYAGLVIDDGTLDHYFVDYAALGARPAFQLNLDSVLFESLAEGGKPEAGGVFRPYTEPTAAQDRKLTLLDSSRSGFAASAACTEVVPGGSLAIAYQGVAPGDYVSAMLYDESGAILYYASVTPDSSGSGIWNLGIPRELAEGSYTLKVFSEQRNGDKKTDYASVPVAMELTVEKYDLINGIPASDGGYIWMGSEGDPIRWRVIGANSSNYLLISAEVLGGTMDWNSALNYCGTLFTSRFSDVERAAVPTTTKSEPTDYQYISDDWYYFGPSTVNGNMFLLSAEEAETYFSEDDARQPGWWWLRSLLINDDIRAGCVFGGGYLNDYYVDLELTFGARPAFQLNLDSVLFESLAEGGKPEAGGVFRPYTQPTAAQDRKLTLIDSARSGFAASAACTEVVPGGSLAIAYQGVISGDYVSAMLCDDAGTALYYASVTPDSSGSGIWNLAIPDEIAEGSYTLKVFSEQRNGDKKTDYASSPVEIELTVSGSPVETYTVIYKVVNGTWADGTTEDKTETVADGSSPETVPTGMLPASGFTGGAWDNDPADATITEDTTFTYTFEKNDAPDYTVRFDANVPANASTVCVGSMEDQSFAYSERKALSENGYSLPGYNFEGWNTKADGTGTPYADQAEVQGLSEDGGTVVLYAQWSGKPYTIEYWSNDAGSRKHVQTAYFDKPGKLDVYSDRAFGWDSGGMTLHGWFGTGFGSFLEDGDDFVNLCGAPDADGNVADPVIVADWVQEGQIAITVTKDGVPQEGLEEYFSLVSDGITFKVPFEYQNGKYSFDPTKVEGHGGLPALLPSGTYELKLDAPGYPSASTSITYGDVDLVSVVFDYYTVSLNKDPVYASAESIVISGEEAVMVGDATVLVLDGGTADIETTVSEGYNFTGYTAVGVAPVWEGGDSSKAKQTIVVQGKADIAANVEPIEYTVTVEGGAADVATAHVGDTVTITADAPEAGKAFVQWAHVDGVDFGNASSTSTTFTMPAKDVTVTAVFAPIVIGDIEDKAYTGERIEPFDEVKVSLDGVDLILTTDDYEVSFDGNVDAGTATATVTMKGPRAGSATATFEILPADISGAEVTATSQVYDGTELKPTPAVTWNGKTLTTDDYTLSYSGNVNAGQATITVTGEGNFTGTASGTFEIAKRQATITVNNASKVQGEDDPPFAGTVEGLVADGDLGEVSYKRTNDDEDPGTYEGVLTAAYTENDNYDVSVTKGDFTIKTLLTVTWLAGDGGVLQAKTYGEGDEPPAYDGKEPTKAATAQYTYAFTGWDDGTVDGTTTTYRPIFSETANEYTVWFVNDDGTELQSGKVAYGQTPEYKGKAPEKAATAQYTYSFKGWSPEVAAVTGNATYTATYTETVNKYKVTFVDYDGSTVLKEAAGYDYGTPAADVEKPADPTREPDAEYNYEFSGWTPEVADVTADAVYTAVYESGKRSYEVAWLQDDGTLIDKTTVEYGEKPAHADPTKEATAQYTYTFAGWTPEVVAVTGDATYKATYTETAKKGTLIFDCGGGTIDGKTSLTIEANVGDTITIPEAPVREGYTFKYWKGSEYYPGDKYTVEGDHTFTAVWEKKSDDGGGSDSGGGNGNNGSSTKGTSTPSTGAKSSSPNTGDTSGGAVTALIITAACAFFLATFALRKRRRQLSEHSGKHMKR